MNNYFTDSYEYSGAYTYENQSQLGHNLHFMSLAGKRLVDNNGVKEFEYSTSDHLGNTRQMFTLNGSIISIKQDNHYYAFGLQIDELKSSSTNTNRLTYNNKEKDLDLGDALSLSKGWYHGVYPEYSRGRARFYDPAVGRWWSVDPAHETYSPYVYVMNSPINAIDPNGMFTDRVNADGSVTHIDDGIDQVQYYNSEANQWETLTDNSGNVITMTVFNEMTATLYAEATPGLNNSNEIFSIASVIKNRADHSNRTMLDIMQNEGIFGNSSETFHTVFDRLEGKSSSWISSGITRTSRLGLVNAITGGTDHSNGAYFWEGLRFLNSRSSFYNTNNMFVRNGWGTTNGLQTGFVLFNEIVRHGNTVFMQYNPTYSNNIWP